jgi:hypothetical protein
MTTARKVAALRACLHAGGSESAPPAAAAGLQVAIQEEREIRGFGFPGEEGTVVITKDPGFEDVIIEVFRKTGLLGKLTKVAIRAFTRKELRDICQWSAREMPGGKPNAFYAWLSDLVEIRRAQNSCDARIHLRGYDGFEGLRADMHSMLDAHREKAPSWQWASETTDQKKSDKARSEVFAAAQRLGIHEEVADALHDCFLRLRTTGSASIDEQEFHTFLIHICRVRDQVCVEQAQIHRYWCELHDRAPLQMVGFARFADWLVAKFPHTSSMTAWQIRRFAGVNK